MIELLVSCPEPGGKKLRRVYELQRTHEEIARVIKLSEGVPNLFSGQTCFQSIDNLYDPEKLYFLVDDVGIIAAVPDGLGAAHVHITFWDKRLRGRETLCKGVARWLLENMNLMVLWTAIPYASRATLAFAKRLGFKERESSLPNNAFLVLTKEDLRGT